MNNELMYGYVNDIDRDFMSYEMAVDVELDKVELALEMADRKYDLALKQSNLKVLTEGGTYDDISQLYEAAAEENKEASEGIISKAIKAVLNFVRNIINKIKSLFGSKEEEDLKNAGNKMIQLPGNPAEHIKGLKGKLNELAAFLKPGFHATDADGNKAFSISKTIVTGLEAVGAAVGVKFAASKLIEFFHGYKSVEDESQKVLEGAEENLKSITDESQKKAANAAIQGVKNICSSAQKGWQALYKAASGAIDGFGKAIKGAVSGNKDKDKDQKQIEGPKAGDQKAVEDKHSDYREMDSMDESADDDIDFDTQSILESCEDIINLFD